MALLESLQWRYAAKRMNGQAVPQEKVNQIIEAARLAPTSAGIQPFRIIEITNKELKEKIKPIANNQPQITECSHLLVFAAWDNYTKERLEKYITVAKGERPGAETFLNDYHNRLNTMLLPRTQEENFAHAARQAYIGFGIAIAAAAELNVDATPMEGFNNAALDELLDLKSKGLRSVTLLPLGYRDTANDWLVNQKKVRMPIKDFVIELN